MEVTAQVSKENGFDHCPGIEGSIRLWGSRDRTANAAKGKTNTDTFEFLLLLVSRLVADLQTTSKWYHNFVLKGYIFSGGML